MKTYNEFLSEATINKMVRNTKERDTAMISRDRGGARVMLGIRKR